MSPSTKFIRCAVLLTLAILPALAQTGNGVVQGTLFDASKATLPNARVSLKNADTGVVQVTTANSAGVYYFSAVQPGQYVLTAEAAGFRRWEATLTVETGQRATIDPAL